MKIAAVLLAIVGAFLTLVAGYLFWAGSFGQIAVRVPSYPWHVLVAFLGAAIGGITAIWRAGIGAALLAIAVAALILLDLKMVHWVVYQASERDVGISNVLANASIGFLLPIAILALSAFFAWKRRRPKPAAVSVQ